MFVQQLKGLKVGQMANRGVDPNFEVVWIGSLFQHLVVVVRLQKERMALLQVIFNVVAWCANIRENAYVQAIRLNSEGGGFCGIVVF